MSTAAEPVRWYAQRIVDAQARPSDSTDCPCHRSQRQGHGLTHCFLHADNTGSLNVDVKGGELLVHCHAGCDQKELIAQLREQEMFPPLEERTSTSTRPEIIAEYDYFDEQGTLLYQALRYHPKNFKQRQPDGKGGWTWSLNGVRRVLYKLPQLLASDKRIVFVVEGEKDVDRLTAEDLVATTSPQGAGKWQPEFAEFLKGRHVILVPDNDDPGRNHMHTAARSLVATAASVKWLDLPGLPEKGDTSDYLVAHTIEEFRELARHAGVVPAEKAAQTTFKREGLSYRYQPSVAKVEFVLSRIKDVRDDVSVELVAQRIGQRLPFVHRRVNLLQASGVPKSLLDDLKEQDFGQDIAWKDVLSDCFERVIDAHRNGLVLEFAGGNQLRPPNATWLCDGLVMEDKLNCWLGSGSTGKSTLAKLLATCCATGNRFLGRSTLECQSLYLDWEDERHDFTRYILDLCRNLGVTHPPEIPWIRMKGKRLRDNIDSVARYIDQTDAKLVIIDAIAAAGGAGGDHRNWEDIALELDACIGQLPMVTVLGLDHVSGDDHRNAKVRVPIKARGSERKFEIYRNQWSLLADEEMREHGHHVVNWYHTKINAGTYRPSFSVEIEHRTDEISVHEVTMSASPAAKEHRTDIGQAELWVKDHPGCSFDQVVAYVHDGVPDKDRTSKRDSLRRAMQRSRTFERDAGGFWWIAGHPDMPRQLSGPLSGEIETDEDRE